MDPSILHGLIWKSVGLQGCICHGPLSETLLKYAEEIETHNNGKEIERTRRIKEEDEQEDDDDLAVRLHCMSLGLHKRETTTKREKTGEELPWGKYGLWRQEQKTRAARLEKQLQARWELENLIDEELSRYHTYYNRANTPARLKDISELLMPKWAPPCELAVLSWLGDWRPSSILDLLRALLVHSSSSPSSSFPSAFSCSGNAERVLSQMIHDIRIEEAVLDEELAEIQATCVLYLPFSPVNQQKGAAALACVQSEFKNIHKVITKAQQLRFKALELAVKKVLPQTDAAKFLVAFAGIQETIHQFAEHRRLRKGPVSSPVKPKGPVSSPVKTVGAT